METPHEKISSLAADPEHIIEGSRFWAVILLKDGLFLAAWLDGGGELYTKTYKSPTAARKVAESNWGT